MIGQTYILNQDEELWDKNLPEQIEKLLSSEVDPLADRTARAHTKETKGRLKHKVISYRVPHNAAAQIYDYKAKRARSADIRNIPCQFSLCCSFVVILFFGYWL